MSPDETDDDDVDDLFCEVCGESLFGEDLVMLSPRRVVPANRACYLACDPDQFSTLHRNCVVNWLDGLWVRVESDVRMPGDNA